jgi:hypothetical protein
MPDKDIVVQCGPDTIRSLLFSDHNLPPGQPLNSAPDEQPPKRRLVLRPAREGPNGVKPHRNNRFGFVENLALDDERMSALSLLKPASDNARFTTKREETGSSPGSET